MRPGSRFGAAAAGSVLLLLALPGTLRADSDGYYCVGPDYLAYHVRGALDRWHQGGEHRMYVVRLDGEGVRWGGTLALPADFQPHLLECRADRIRFVGWDEGWVETVVALDAERAPTLRSFRTDPAREAEHGSLEGNLGEWSGAFGDTRTTPLQVAAGDLAFVLESEEATFRGDQGCLNRHVSRIRSQGGEGLPWHRRELVVWDSTAHCPDYGHDAASAPAPPEAPPAPHVPVAPPAA